MQTQIATKLKNLNSSNPLQSIREFVAVRPVGCKTKQTIAQDMEGFQFIVNKIPEKQFDTLVKQLSEKECQLVLDYLHRYMQYITETQNNLSTGQYLSLYDKIVALHGPSIIINAISRNDTLTNRKPEF